MRELAGPHIVAGGCQQQLRACGRVALGQRGSTLEPHGRVLECKAALGQPAGLAAVAEGLFVEAEDVRGQVVMRQAGGERSMWRLTFEGLRGAGVKKRPARGRHAVQHRLAGQGVRERIVVAGRAVRLDQRHRRGHVEQGQRRGPIGLARRHQGGQVERGAEDRGQLDRRPHVVIERQQPRRQRVADRGGHPLGGPQCSDAASPLEIGPQLAEEERVAASPVPEQGRRSARLARGQTRPQC